MTDLEMLQLAAEAGGVDIDWTRKKGQYFSIRGTPYFWNAACNDKQAFELADALRLMVSITDRYVKVLCGVDHVVEIAYDTVNSRMSINRLAIVMITAQIQRARDAKAR